MAFLMTCRNLSKWQSHRQCQVAKWSERTDSTVKVLVMLINLQATLGKWMDTDWCVQPYKFQFSLPWQCSSGVLSLVCKGSLTFTPALANSLCFWSRILKYLSKLQSKHGHEMNDFAVKMCRRNPRKGVYWNCMQHIPFKLMTKNASPFQFKSLVSLLMKWFFCRFWQRIWLGHTLDVCNDFAISHCQKRPLTWTLHHAK